MATNAIAWGNPETVEAPYWMLFSCHNYSKFFQDRAPLNQLLGEILLPGTIVSRDTMMMLQSKKDFSTSEMHWGKKLVVIQARI